MPTIYDETNKVWSNSEQNSENGPETSLGHKILNCMTNYGDNIYQISDDTDVRMTYNMLRLKTVRAAQNLKKLGFYQGQKFAFLANNSDNVAPIFFASICLSCTIVPLHTMLAKDEMVRFLDKTRPVIVFSDASAFEQLNDALNELKLSPKVYTFGENNYKLESVESLFAETGNDEENFVPAEHNRDKDLAAIFSSSGTTGPFKYVCASYGYQNFWHFSKYDVRDVVLSFDTIYWTVGTRPMIQVLFSGATRIITTKPFSTKLQFKLIEKYKVTILFNIPPYIIASLKSDAIDQADLSSVKLLFTFGCKMHPSWFDDINRCFPNAEINYAYGASESGAISICATNGNSLSNRGILCPGRQVKIIDENGVRCGPNVRGEILARSKYQSLGYLNDPEANSAAFDDEGFFRTGDLGHFDENGFLYYEERKKDVIKVFYFRGVLIPSDIDEYLITMPGVKDVCTVGIPIVSGFSLPAAVVVRNLNSNLSQRDVFNMVADNFPNQHKVRGGVYFVDAIPKTHTGKNIRRDVTEMAIEMFKATKDSDPDLMSFLSDISEDFRRLL